MRAREQRGRQRGETKKERKKGREGEGVGLDGLVSLDVTRSGNCVRRE